MKIQIKINLIKYGDINIYLIFYILITLNCHVRKRLSIAIK